MRISVEANECAGVLTATVGLSTTHKRGVELPYRAGGRDHPPESRRLITGAFFSIDITRLTTCSHWDSLATLEGRRVFNNGEVEGDRPSARVTHYEEDINCPQCGPRTQEVNLDLL